MTSTTPDAAVAKRWQQEAAASAVQGWMASVYQSAGYSALAAALADTVRDGMAEGEADAMTAAASQQELGRLDTGAAFTVALATLQGDYGVTRQAQEAVAGLVSGAAAAAARALAGQPDGSSEDEAADALRAGASGMLGRAVDYLLWAAFGAGAMALWKQAASAAGNLSASRGVMISWIAGASSCQVCQQNDAGSPYAPEDLPSFPAHANCACSLESDTPVPLSFLAPFLN